MKPLIILISLFFIGLLINAFSVKNKRWSTYQIGRASMSGMLFFTGMAHFAFYEGMSYSIPPIIPYPEGFVLLTGVIEILAGIGLLIKRYQKITGILLIIFFILVLPANIYAAVNHIDPITGKEDGPGKGYLFLRLPTQFFYIAWTYYFTFFKIYKTNTLKHSTTIIKVLSTGSMLILFSCSYTSCIGQHLDVQNPLARAYIKDYVNLRFENLRDHYTDQSSFQDPTLQLISIEAAQKVIGPEAILKKLNRNFKGIRRPEYILHQYFHAGNYHVFYGTYSYTQNATNFNGPDQDIQFSLESMTILYIDDGKVIHHTDYMDYNSWFNQFNNQKNK